jgi:CubicO group peptidase (beta-lactamase class C family)
MYKMYKMNGQLFRCLVPAAVLTASFAAVAQPAKTSPAVPEAPAAAATATPLDRVMNGAEKAGFEGVVLVGDGSKVLFEKAVGTADRIRKTPHNVTNQWRWASVTKQVTATIVAQLVAEKKLDLDKPISTWLTPVQFNGRDAKKITIRNLLQHTSGLPNPDDGAPKDGVSPFYKRAVSPEGLHVMPARGFCAGDPKGNPGEKFEYNNCDYIVLAAIIEVVEQKSFSEVLDARIARPLGLARFGLASSENAIAKRNVDAEAVQGYLDKSKEEQKFNLASYGAAGALVGTPKDMLAFDRALLGDSLMSKEMKAKFWAGDAKLGYAALGAWSFPATLNGCEQPVNLVERRGAIGGIQVRNILAPDKGRAVVVFTNRADWQFGEVWQGKGFSHELLSAALCGDAK